MRTRLTLFAFDREEEEGVVGLTDPGAASSSKAMARAASLQQAADFALMPSPMVPQTGEATGQIGRWNGGMPMAERAFP